MDQRFLDSIAELILKEPSISAVDISLSQIDKRPIVKFSNYEEGTELGDLIIAIENEWFIIHTGKVNDSSRSSFAYLLQAKIDGSKHFNSQSSKRQFDLYSNWPKFWIKKPKKISIELNQGFDFKPNQFQALSNSKSGILMIFRELQKRLLVKPLDGDIIQKDIAFDNLLTEMSKQKSGWPLTASNDFSRIINFLIEEGKKAKFRRSGRSAPRTKMAFARNEQMYSYLKSEFENMWFQAESRIRFCTKLLAFFKAKFCRRRSMYVLKIRILGCDY